MADIKGPQGVQAAAWRAYGNAQHGAGRHGTGQGRGEGEDGHPDPVDAVRILGLNPRAYPPEVQDVLSALLAQIDHLRHDLEQAVARQHWLEGQADQDAFLPVLNRKAFVRAVEAYLANHDMAEVPGDVGQGPEPGALAVFHLANFDLLHRRFGLSAALAAQVHMAAVVQAGLRASDAVGAIGGPAICVLLGLSGRAAAVAKVDSLRTALAAQPAAHDGKMLPLRVVAEVVELDRTEGVEERLGALDERLRQALREAQEQA